MRLYATIVQTLGILALVALVSGAALLLALAVPSGRAALRRRLVGLERHVLGWAWAVALIAMSGSLYLSDVVGLVPCLLCWYQRIAMYPLVLVLGVGVVRNEPAAWRYGLPLPLVGFVIAAYHVALQLQPSLDVVSCSSGAPCTARYLAVFGFVSIPWMAGAAFLLITALLLTLRTLGRPDVPAAETFEASGDGGATGESPGETGSGAG
ncbi:MAG TPA: disulfide bond formation protein B [Longimicrobiales bacterium]|nr:disulfide bond formation protein B [Longimicrobiales bacterium]